MALEESGNVLNKEFNCVKICSTEALFLRISQWNTNENTIIRNKTNTLQASIVIERL